MASYASSSSSSSKKMKLLNQDEETAIVVSLPDHVIETIISFMPIKNAVVASSSMAKRFLTAWRFSRDLSFDIDFERFHNPADIFKVINRVMNEHSGPVIERFSVVINPSDNENLVFDWIRKAVAKGVQELHLDFSSGDRAFRLPYDLLDGACLQILKVNWCDLRSLKQLDGFNSLKTIIFKDSCIPFAFSKAIFKNCLFLENFELNGCFSEFRLVIYGSQLKNFKSLKVINCLKLHNINVDAPSLQVFHYIGDICCIGLKRKMPQMKEAFIHFSYPSYLYAGVERLMIALKSIRTLSISCSVLEILCPRFLEVDNREFQFCLWNVRDLRLGLSSELETLFLNPYDIIRFLNKSPYIEKFTLDFGTKPLKSGATWWKTQRKEKFEKHIPYFNFLNTVRFINFKFQREEMLIAKFIIGNGKALDNCIIVKSKDHLGATRNETSFLRWLSTTKPTKTIYEHDEHDDPSFALDY